MVLLKYRVNYPVPEDLFMNGELLAAVRDRPALPHVFPFLRAHAVDLTTRAGLPPPSFL